MKIRFKKHFSLLFTCLTLCYCFEQQTFAQSAENLNFHSGFTGWSARPGTYDGTATAPIFNWGALSNTPGSLTDAGGAIFTINTDTTAIDTETNVLKKIPPGYQRSVKMQNTQIWDKSCAQLRYTITNITQANSLFTFNYAVVLQAPSHSGYVNPTFQVKVLKHDIYGDPTNELLHLCTFVEQQGIIVNNQAPAGWHLYSVPNSSDQGIWLDWQKVSLSLRDYIGQPVTIEINISDCEYKGHYGYCYFVGQCEPADIKTDACSKGDTVSLLSVPEGFSRYEWFQDPTGVTPEETVATGTPISTLQKFPILRGMFPDNVNIQHYICKITSITGCVSYMRTSVRNTKPYPQFLSDIDCDKKGTFTNQTFVGNNLNLSWMEWDFGDGTPVIRCDSAEILANSPKLNPIHYFPDAENNETYTVRLRAAVTNCEQEFTQDVRVFASPDLTIPDTVRGCANIPITIEASSRLADTIKWVIEGETDTIIGPIARGAFLESKKIYVLSISNNVDCPKTDSLFVYIEGFPKVILDGKTNLCLGEETTLTVTDSNNLAKAFQWTFERPSLSPVIDHTQINPSVTIKPIRDTIIYLIAQTQNGCVGWDSTIITIVNPLVSADRVVTCPNINGDKSFPIKLWGLKAQNYSWSASPNDSSLPAIPSTDTITVYPSETTTYTMKGYGTTGCFVEKMITIDIIPFPIATILFSPSFVDPDNPSMKFQDNSPHGESSEWDFLGTASTEKTLIHAFNIVSDMDSIEVKLTSRNKLGCSDSTSVKIPVNWFSVFVPNAFVPINNGINSDFNIYTLRDLFDFKFTIYDRWGHIVYNFETGQLPAQKSPTGASPCSWDGNFKGKPVPQGTYIYKTSFKRDAFSKKIEQTGTINLIR